MTALEYRDALRRLEMSHEYSAKVLGISEAISRRRASGEVKVPPEAAVLLRLMLAMKISPHQVLEHVATTK